MPINTMQTYTDMEKHQQALAEQIKKRDLECISCPKCQCQFFEEVEVMKYLSNHNVLLGQKVPTKPGNQPYIFLKCIKCGDLLEPRVDLMARDPLGGDYEQLLDALEEKPEKKEDNAIPAEKL